MIHRIPKSKEVKKAIRQALNEERDNITTLVFAARFTNDSKYREGAKSRLLELSKWSPTGGSSHATNDLANADAFVSLSVGLGLLSDSLSDSQQKSIAGVIKARIGPVMGDFASLDERPYQSILTELGREVVHALIYSVGRFPEAEAWLATSWDAYSSTLATWGSDDGGWGNGNGYGWNNLDGFGEAIAAVRLIAGVDLAQDPWVQRMGYSLIALTAAGGTHMSAFGDDAEDTGNYSRFSKDLFRLYAALTRSEQHSWYWRVGEPDTSVNTVISPYHFMLLGLGMPDVVPAPPTNHSWIFADAGVVAMHDDVSATDRSSVFFRSSRFGNYSHSHADQNAFTLVSKGRDLLISGGYYPYYNSPHHATVTRATRYKNALTFDGGIGQAEPVKNPSAPGKPKQSMDTRGELINYKVQGNWTVSTGDAALAYRGWDKSAGWTPLLNTAIRTVAYNRQEHVVVIYDWARSDTARRWELNFNGLEAFTASGASAKITNQSSSACIDVYGASGTFSTSKGFAVAPEGDYPTQYQARYRANSASNELVAVTVVREFCRNVPVNVSTRGTSVSVSINGGSPLDFDGRTVTMP